MYDKEMLDNFSRDYAQKCRVTDQISAELFDANGVLRGLRDKNGNGVVAGLTNISKIESFRWKMDRRSHVMVISGIVDTMSLIW